MKIGTIKNVFIVLFILLVNISFSQGIEDIGKKTFQDIKNMNKIKPCEITENRVLTYCVEGGSRISYIFEDNRLHGIMCLTAYLTRTLAENALEQEVNTFSKRNNITPTYTNGAALFDLSPSPLAVSYGVMGIRGTFYLCYYTFLSN